MFITQCSYLVRHLFKGGVYSRACLISKRDLVNCSCRAAIDKQRIDMGSNTKSSFCHKMLQFGQFYPKKVEQGSFQEIREFCFQPAGLIIFVQKWLSETVSPVTLF